MAFDFKKEQKELYLPPKKPTLVVVPKMNYIAVRGQGDPNEEGGEYQKAIGILYAIAYTLRMSYKTEYTMEGFFEYVVPPLEGLWWQETIQGYDKNRKEDFQWIALIRLPEFVKKEDFEWAKEQVKSKKKIDCDKANILSMEEGLCVQMMHIGSFDEESSSVAWMDDFLKENGYQNDFSDQRYHHEIYLSDIRKVSSSKWKTVIRHPIKKLSIDHSSSVFIEPKEV